VFWALGVQDLMNYDAWWDYVARHRYIEDGTGNIGAASADYYDYYEATRDAFAIMSAVCDGTSLVVTWNRYATITDADVGTAFSLSDGTAISSVEKTGPREFTFTLDAEPANGTTLDFASASGDLFDAGHNLMGDQSIAISISGLVSTEAAVRAFFPGTPGVPGGPGDLTDLMYPMAEAEIVSVGQAVGRVDGYARALQAGDPFLGFALFLPADNLNGADGDLSVEVRTRGLVFAEISGVAQTNLGDKVYMSAASTFTLTSSSNSLIGHIVAVPETGKAIVKYELQPD
jgi:hypothetical protein